MREYEALHERIDAIPHDYVVVGNRSFTRSELHQGIGKDMQITDYIQGLLSHEANREQLTRAHNVRWATLFQI